MTYKILRVLIAVSLLTMTAVSIPRAQHSISVDTVIGMLPDSTVRVNHPVRFVVRLSNQATDTISGWELTWRTFTGSSGTPTGNYDPFSVEFDSLPLPGGWSSYNISAAWQHIGGTGILDTLRSIAHNGATPQGITPGFSEPIAYIEITPTAIGDTLVVDSVTGGWWTVFATNGTTDFDATWSGRLELPVVECCYGIRGNTDGDPSHTIDINDLTYVVARGFLGGPDYLCPEEGDVNGDGELTGFIVDLTSMIDYLFRGGPPPAPCP